MKISISDHFDYGRLLRYTASPIIMMVFTSIYGVVDGIFVSKYVGGNALASINIIWPMIMIVGSFGMMLGAGGSAVIARTMGENKPDDARRYFTTLIIAIGVTGIVLSSVCLIFLKPLSYLFGSSDLLLEDCLKYGQIMLAGTTFFMLQSAFQTLFSTAGKPKVGLFLTVFSGIANMTLDYLLIGVFGLGVRGAAAATVSSYLIGGLLPLLYFAGKNTSTLSFVPTRFYGKMLLESCFNGISEMVTNLSSSLVLVLFNRWLMKLAGEAGVSAISIIMYVDFPFRAIIFGFTIGIAPIIGYNYGANNIPELRNVFRMASRLVILMSLGMFLIGLGSRDLITSLFLEKTDPLYQLTRDGFSTYIWCYLTGGVSIFASSLFTALCSGKISGLISLCRGAILPVIMINLLGSLIGLNGIWMANPVSEAICCLISLLLIVINRNTYFYY